MTSQNSLTPDEAEPAALSLFWLFSTIESGLFCREPYAAGDGGAPVVRKFVSQSLCGGIERQERCVFDLSIFIEL
ncbi:MAG: hypothetical protein AB2L14_04275 [Candidatus Xenobiia bacterium LiM19]